MTTEREHFVSGLTSEEQKKRAVFDAMSPRSRKRILDKGYENWDPFILPKDPVDIRMAQHRETALSLIRGFLHACPPEKRSNEYEQGAWEASMGIVVGNDHWRGGIRLFLLAP